MPVVMVPAWKCGECTHVWLKVGDKEPTHCASSKCRSRKWNKGGGAAVMVAEASLAEREIVYEEHA